MKSTDMMSGASLDSGVFSSLNQTDTQVDKDWTLKSQFRMQTNTYSFKNWQDIRLQSYSSESLEILGILEDA